jgi:hypothetical protein
MDNVAHCLSVSLRRSRSFAESCSPKQWTATFPTGAPLQRSPLSLVYFHGLQLAAPSCHGQWTHLTRIFPPTIQLPAASDRAVRRAPCTRMGATCALRAVWPVTWAVHVLRYGPRRARPHPVDAGPCRLHVMCVWAGCTRFGLWTVF